MWLFRATLFIGCWWHNVDISTLRIFCIEAKQPNFNCKTFSFLILSKLSWTISHANNYSNISAVKWHLNISRWTSRWAFHARMFCLGRPSLSFGWYQIILLVDRGMHVSVCVCVWPTCPKLLRQVSGSWTYYDLMIAVVIITPSCQIFTIHWS